VERLRDNVNLELMSTFSIGVGSQVHRVVLPPEWQGPSFSNEDETRTRLFTLRDAARQLIDLTARASVLVGLPEWRTT
jgi:hypothetical protein